MKHIQSTGVEEFHGPHPAGYLATTAQTLLDSRKLFPSACCIGVQAAAFAVCFAQSSCSNWLHPDHHQCLTMSRCAWPNVRRKERSSYFCLARFCCEWTLRLRAQCSGERERERERERGSQQQAVYDLRTIS